MWSRAVLVVSMVGACGRGGPARQALEGGSAAGSQDPPATATTVPSIAIDAAAPIGPTGAASTADPGAAAPAASRGGRGDRCSADADCGWDDPCTPRRCGRAAGAPGPGCDKSWPPPGTCTCVEHQCTLRPDDPARGASDSGCRSDDECAVDVAAATCHLRGDSLIGPIEEQGPVCTCSEGRCVWRWTGPVRCTSWRDCSWVRTSRLRPVAAGEVPRPVPRPVRPCKDGERDSVCGPGGVCRIVAWGC
jgi:hypothetical protein